MEEVPRVVVEVLEVPIFNQLTLCKKVVIQMSIGSNLMAEVHRPNPLFHRRLSTTRQPWRSSQDL